MESDFSTIELAKTSSTSWLDIAKSYFKCPLWVTPFLNIIPQNDASNIPESNNKKLSQSRKHIIVKDISQLVKKKPKA